MQIQEQQHGARLVTSLPVTGTDSLLDASTIVNETRLRWGKAPPVDPFTGEDLVSTLDDWFPSLQTAATWYG